MFRNNTFNNKLVLEIVIVLQCVLNVGTQLLINVQNQGGEVVQESITSNVADDLITLEFQKTDGTLITEILDFRNEVQIVKSVILGEEERGQNQYQVMCFVTKLSKNDFISADAMSKLRQKNPTTIRIPEEDRGKENFTMNSWVVYDKSQDISRHIMPLCLEAKDSTYVQSNDIKLWENLTGSSSLEYAIVPFPPQFSLRCNEVTGIWAPCVCALKLCIGWYPCGLKYCKGKYDSLNNKISNVNTSYRCGIKTCKKCIHFYYYVRQKQQCLWDE